MIQGQTVDKDSLQDAILSAEDMNKAGKKINSWVGTRKKCISGNMTNFVILSFLRLRIVNSIFIDSQKY